jgi:hypothetical protein
MALLQTRLQNRRDHSRWIVAMPYAFSGEMVAAAMSARANHSLQNGIARQPYVIDFLQPNCY